MLDRRPEETRSFSGHGASPRSGGNPPFVARNPRMATAIRGTDESPGVRSGLDHRTRDALGPLAEFVADPDVTDVLVTGGAGVWVDRGAGAARVEHLVLSESDTRDLAEVVISSAGRHLDESTPCVDARLADGIRVHAVLHPVSILGTALSIRVQRHEYPTLAQLHDSGFFRSVPIAIVNELVRSRANVLISGASGSGKTTLLAAILAAASPAERIVAVEDVAELRVAHPHVIALEARQPNHEGRGAIGLDRLVREALRMRPDRLVVGECRGGEIRELLSALNTGHDGGGGTLHANSIADVPARLEALAALAEMSPSALARQAVSAIDSVLHVARTPAGRELVAVARLRLGARGRLVIDSPNR